MDKDIIEDIKTPEEKIVEYAEEHGFGENNKEDPMIKELALQKIEYIDQFKEKILPMAVTDLRERVGNFIDGNEDQEIQKTLTNINYNYTDLLDNRERRDEKIKKIVEMFLIGQSYSRCLAENKGREIDFVGFHEDKDLKDIKKLMYKMFGKDLLEQCLISEIKYRGDLVIIVVKGRTYLISPDEYKQWVYEMPEVKEHKFRAKSFANWNTAYYFSKKYIKTPIFFYSFEGENPNSLEHFKKIPPSEAMKRYKIGTISHEIGHHIFYYLIDNTKRKELEEIMEENINITEYIKKYENRDRETLMSEYFAEIIRLKAINPRYLNKKAPKMNGFLKRYFPSIKSLYYL